MVAVAAMSKLKTAAAAMAVAVAAVVVAAAAAAAAAVAGAAVAAVAAGAVKEAGGIRLLWRTQYPLPRQSTPVTSRAGAGCAHWF